MTSQTRLGIVLSICMILAAHVEPPPWHGQPEWARAAWIPFVSPPVRLRDIAQNVLLFLPFGFFIASAFRQRSSGARVIAVVATAAALSMSLEILQLFMPQRFPSMTDVVSNVTGAAIGAAILLLERPAAFDQY